MQTTKTLIRPGGPEYLLGALVISSRKHAYIIFTPLNPTFIQQNSGFARVCIIFLLLLKNIDCGYSLEPPCHFDALTELRAFMRTECLCISVFRVASGPRVKLVSCKSALNPPVIYSTDCSKVVVPVLVLLFVALRFILRGDLLYGLPCVILFFCFSVLLALRLPRLGKRELILVLFVRLFDLCLFGFVGFLFLLVSRKGCGW